jgi:1-acyl-sn-glycerol-3-phosphate acyltransferase
VVPIAIVGTYELLPMNSFHVRPGTVQMIIGEPIPTKGLHVREMDKLAQQVREVMAEMYYSRWKPALVMARSGETNPSAVDAGSEAHEDLS